MPRQPLSWISITQLLLTTFAFVLMTWAWLEWKGVVILLPLWIGYEIVYRIRLRALLACPHCGFNPYLYTVNVKLARNEIDQYWRKKLSEKGIPYPEKKPATLDGNSAQK